MKLEIHPRIFHFKKPAGTSRGTYLDRKSWLIKVTSDEEPEKVAWGECAPLPLLSCDDTEAYATVLKRCCRDVEEGKWESMNLCDFPSIRFGLETALYHWKRGSYAFWDTPFSRGEQGIRINGLVWMGDYAYMYRQIKDKIDKGFRCIKLKIGAIDFEEELSLLRFIRRQFTANEIELRVDANGAFSPEGALEKMERLAELELHSIEQPIRAGQWKALADLTSCTPLPIALDEEMIGCNSLNDKILLLESVRPQYIVLKPSLHGGMAGCNEWIELAEHRNIGWWITSALESNIGLNAIAQWSAAKPLSGAQGLGTGQLYVDNIPMPLEIRNDALWYVQD